MPVYSSEWYTTFCQKWVNKNWDMTEGLQRLSESLDISVACAAEVWYAAQRSRGTDEYIRGIISKDQKAPVKSSSEWTVVGRKGLVRLPVQAWK